MILALILLAVVTVAATAGAVSIGRSPQPQRDPSLVWSAARGWHTPDAW